MNGINESEDILRATIEEYSPLGQGKSAFADLTGINSIDDIYYWQDSKQLNIRFGKFDLPIEKDLIYTKKILDLLSQLDITVKLKSSKDKSFIILYKDQKIKEVVK